MACTTAAYIEGQQSLGMAVPACKWIPVCGFQMGDQVETELGVRIEVGIITGQGGLLALMIGVA